MFLNEGLSFTGSDEQTKGPQPRKVEGFCFAHQTESVRNDSVKTE